MSGAGTRPVTYTAWIGSYLRSIAPQSPKGMCGAAVAAMVLEFPELQPVSGFVDVEGEDWLKPHWWAVAPDGTIVDPTASQFERINEYVEAPTAYLRTIGR